MSQTAIETVSNAANKLSVTSHEETASAEQRVPVYKYSHLLPIFDPTERYPPLEAFEHVDPGLRALSHSDPRSFLGNAITEEITPRFGTEISGVDLLSLDSEGRDQLALETASRGVLVFRNQVQWLNADTNAWLAFGSYFGRPHIHPTSGHPAGYPQIHLVYRDATASFNFEIDQMITSTLWHSDVSYELQPPGLTIFFLLDQPKTGGDTLFVSQTAVLHRFSPPFVAFLRTLKAVHSAVEQAEYSRSGKRGGIVRREPVENVHPVIRRHPVTGEEALYVNKQFTRRIVGLKKEESDNLLNFLYDAVAKAHDSQLRVKWRPNTVVVWDNRVTAHSANVDFASAERRHGARLAAQAEKPVAALKGI